MPINVNADSVSNGREPNNAKGGPTIGPPNLFWVVNFQLVRPALRQRIRILAQEVERGGFFG